FRLRKSEHFVIEADEYDTAFFDKGPKMWHYLPHIAIVNNIEFDHADIYRDETAYLYAFARFINLIPSSGRLIAGSDSPAVRDLSQKAFAPVESFGFDPDGSGADPNGADPNGADPSGADGSDAGGSGPDGSGPAPMWTARDVSFGELTRFTVVRGGAVWGEVETPLSGAFSIRNCLAAIAAAEAIGADPERVREALRTYSSVRRRMEIRGVVNDITVIDDFAHHPTAVRETLLAARQKYTGRRVVAIFEPRSYTAQRREFEADYEKALGIADEIILAGLFHPERYDADTAMQPDRLVSAWQTAGKRAAHEPDVDAIVAHVASSAQAGDIVLIMSNGGFGGIHDKLLSALAG
ncbi:MAG TPA: Mur ligase family protein, partial [Longimicrobiales bacterium]|nr:Mur ligase family protein [Longimicrobiales bacterium]